jgi:hypothetical protein
MTQTNQSPAFPVLNSSSVDVLRIREFESSASLPLSTNGFRAVNTRHLQVPQDGRVIADMSGGNPYAQYWYWQCRDLQREICDRLVDKSSAEPSEYTP